MGTVGEMSRYTLVLMVFTIFLVFTDSVEAAPKAKTLLVETLGEPEAAPEPKPEKKFQTVNPSLNIQMKEIIVTVRNGFQDSLQEPMVTMDCVQGTILATVTTMTTMVITNYALVTLRVDKMEPISVGDPQMLVLIHIGNK